MALIRWPDYINAPVMAFGGDYNPDQWPREVWDEDMALMAKAGVNLVSVGVFSWAKVQPRPGTWEFGWLDEVMDLCAANKIAVDLATMTASTPAWFTMAHPESSLVTEDGVRLTHGARQLWCPSSPAYREASLELVARLAERYGNHPALALWHVGNEFGCHNATCYCDTTADAFRDCLERKYSTIDALNEAWGTAFWAQLYGNFSEVLPPRATSSFHNPTQVLDFRRFCGQALLEQYTAEAEVLHRITPDVPVTTNLMVFSQSWRQMGYGDWAACMDVISNDHYNQSADPRPQVRVAMAADSTRGLAQGKPWLLMEHSTSAVNWQPINRAKMPGELARNSLSHVARGSDSVMFFQWRASASGAEKYHSGMVPHAGPDSDLFRDVCALGKDLTAMSDIAGSEVVCDAALVIDRDSWEATSGETVPSHGLDYEMEAHRWYEAAWDAHLTIDVIDSAADFGKYKVLILPTWYAMSETDVAKVTQFVEGGGRVIVSFFSGIADRDDHIRLGGYPGALRDLLGVRVQEFQPLLADQSVVLDSGATGTIWAERVDVTDAKALWAYTQGPARVIGAPAATEASRGAGKAYYLSTALDGESLTQFVATVADKAGCVRFDLPRDVEGVVRRGESGEYTFLLNHTDEPVTIPCEGTDMATGQSVATLNVPAGEVRIIRR